MPEVERKRFVIDRAGRVRGKHDALLGVLSHEKQWRPLVGAPKVHVLVADMHVAVFVDGHIHVYLKQAVGPAPHDGVGDIADRHAPLEPGGDAIEQPRSLVENDHLAVAVNVHFGREVKRRICVLGTLHLSRVVAHAVLATSSTRRRRMGVCYCLLVALASASMRALRSF
jgi:hypothetical protein